MTIHQPVAAGTFYPDGPGALHATITDLLACAPPLDVPPPKAVILPHAGYRFSGAVAAAGIAALAPDVRRVVVLGPSHRFAFRGIALPDASAMATPLGAVPIDGEITAALLRHAEVRVEPRAHAAEHSVEVELPFLQHRLGEFSVVPLVVGEIATDRLAAILESLWGGDETLIVVSTDLSHFLAATEAERTDLETAHAIEKGDASALDGFRACGHRPLAALLTCAAARGMRITRLALSHSGKVSGDDARVVGYGAWMLHDAETARLSPTHRAGALRLAGRALHGRLGAERAPVDLGEVAMPLRSVAAAFVTLSQDGRLRGCIGTLSAHRALADDIAGNAVGAGFEDPRFRPVTLADLAGVELEIAVLSRAARMLFRDEADLAAQIRPGRDGLILQEGDRRATFLPKVWDQIATPADFLGHLKRKAGLPPDHWSPEIRVWRYIAESFKGTVGPAG